MDLDAIEAAIDGLRDGDAFVLGGLIAALEAKGCVE